MFDRVRALVRLIDLILKLHIYLKPYLDEQSQDEYTPPGYIPSPVPLDDFEEEFEDEPLWMYNPYNASTS